MIYQQQLPRQKKSVRSAYMGPVYRFSMLRFSKLPLSSSVQPKQCTTPLIITSKYILHRTQTMVAV